MARLCSFLLFNWLFLILKTTVICDGKENMNSFLSNMNRGIWLKMCNFAPDLL